MNEPSPTWGEEPEQPSWADQVEIEARRVIRQMFRAAPYRDAYDDTLDEDTDAVARRLEQLASEMRKVRGHQHQWNSLDYCDVCGLDGRS
jgi:hypothetical protein